MFLEGFVFGLVFSLRRISVSNYGVSRKRTVRSGRGVSDWGDTGPGRTRGRGS